MPALSSLAPHAVTIGHYLLILSLAASLGAALGLVRPGRREIVPRAPHVIQAQILLAVVGAIIIVVVAESLARAFAIVGAAGLVRYRARIDDPKDAGVMLVALAVGLTTGSGLFAFAGLACVFVIAVLWLLESLERPVSSSFHLKISTQDPDTIRRDVERMFSEERVTYELRGKAPDELHYKVTVPVKPAIARLTGHIRELRDGKGEPIEWEIDKRKDVQV